MYDIDQGLTPHQALTLSQKERVLRALRRGPVCTSAMLHAYISRGADVIYKLRGDGHAITTEVCHEPDHQHRPGSTLAVYYLEAEWDPKGGWDGNGGWRD